MSLKERLLENMKTAMKDRDTIRKDTIQMARAAVLQVEKDKRVTLDDEGVTDVIAKEVKKRKDVLPEYEKSGRQDLIDALKKEIEILAQYLPSQMSAEEVEALVRETIAGLGAKSASDMGKVMQAVMPKLKGRADGRIVNEMVRKFLL